jgi:hypothetical protein
MRLGILQLSFVAMLVSLSSAAEDIRPPSWPPSFFTNQLAISNGRAVLAAVISGDTQSKTNVQALIGSQVVFEGTGSASPGTMSPGTNANLMVWSNVVLQVDIRPPRDDGSHGAFAWSVKVLGRLKGVDFQKRVIHIEAKPEDWIEMVTM